MSKPDKNGISRRDLLGTSLTAATIAGSAGLVTGGIGTLALDRPDFQPGLFDAQ